MKKLLQKIIGYFVPILPMKIYLKSTKIGQKLITSNLGYSDVIDISDSDGEFLTVIRNGRSITLTFTRIVENEAGSESDKEHPVQPG